MKKQISRVSIFQSSKVLALIPSFLIALVLIPVGIILIFNGIFREGLLALLYPFIVMLLLFLGHAFIFALYNIIAKRFGGIELEFKDVE